MKQNLILAEVKKAIDLWMDHTYNESEFTVIAWPSSVMVESWRMITGSTSSD